MDRGIIVQTVDCDYDFVQGMKMTDELLKKYPEVDGIVACDDIVAVSTYKVLFDKGIQVPEQVQLIGFDDISLASLITPELTTIHQPIEAMAQEAVELIIGQRAPEKKGERFVFPVSLVVRQTTRIKR